MSAQEQIIKLEQGSDSTNKLNLEMRPEKEQPDELMNINGCQIRLFYAKTSDRKPLKEIHQILLNNYTL